MNCEVEDCGNEGSKWRGVGVQRICLCVACYTAATARPGVEARTGLERPEKPPVVPVVEPEPVVVAVPLPAKPYAPVERVSARTIRAQAEGSARYQRLLAWLPPARMITASEVAGELGCSPSQAGRAIRRGIAEGRIRAWPSQGFSLPGFLRPPTVADRIVAFLEKHGESRVADIVAGIGLDCKRVNSAAKSDHRIEQVGRGVLRVRR